MSYKQSLVTLTDKEILEIIEKRLNSSSKQVLGSIQIDINNSYDRIETIRNKVISRFNNKYAVEISPPLESKRFTQYTLKIYRQ